MRITIVTGFFLPVPPVSGGASEKIWHKLAPLLVAAGHEVVFVSRAWPEFASREIVDGVTHVRVRGADHTASLARNLWRDFWWGVRVARMLPPADIVVCNTVTLPAWLRFFKPAVGKVAAVVARMPKGHGHAYRGVALVLSLSNAVTNRLLAENPRLAGRIARFPFPIDWSLHARHASRGAPLTIGYVGRIHPEKGIRLLLAAAAQLASRADLPAWRLELVGPWTVPQGGGGEKFRDALLAEFGHTLGPRLSFAGPEFDADKLARRYGAMDIFCYPSLAEAGETFGVAVAEAMAAGAAPVVSGLACFNELVRDGETGLIFDHTAADAAARLAEALERLLREAELRRQLASAAQAHARQFDFPEVARALLTDFETLLARK